MQAQVQARLALLLLTWSRYALSSSCKMRQPALMCSFWERLPVQWWSSAVVPSFDEAHQQRYCSCALAAASPFLMHCWAAGMSGVMQAVLVHCHIADWTHAATLYCLSGCVVAFFRCGMQDFPAAEPGVYYNVSTLGALGTAGCRAHDVQQQQQWQQLCTNHDSIGRSLLHL
jgi:hypothetical protein